MLELVFQRHLIDALRRADGFGFKLDNKYMSGVPDLLLCHPNYGPVFIETKVIKPNTDIILITPLQSETLKKLRHADCNVGIVILVSTDKAANYSILVSRDIKSTKLNNSYVTLNKMYGEKWPVLEILRQLVT